MNCPLCECDGVRVEMWKKGRGRAVYLECPVCGHLEPIEKKESK